MNNSSAANQSSDEDRSFGLDPKFSYPVAACYLTITAVAVVGNFLVCYAVLANRNLRNNPTNLFILSFAVSDFLTATLVVPFDIESLFVDGAWNHGEAMCIIWQVVYLITIPISVYSLLAISVDRYNTLRDPLGRFRRSQFITRKRAIIVIAIIWINSILWALFPFMGWRKREESATEDGVCMLPYTRLYNILSSFLNIIFPLLITCFFYILIYRIACKNNKFTKRGGFPSIQRHTKEENKMYLKNVKAAKTTAMFVLAIFICWQPYCWFVIADSIDGHNWKSFPYEVYLVLLMFGYLNSALNPFLFAFRNKRFKVAYRKLFTSLKPAVKPDESGLSLRRLSTFSQSTVTSEIPELSDGVVRLRSISYYED